MADGVAVRTPAQRALERITDESPVMVLRFPDSMTATAGNGAPAAAARGSVEETAEHTGAMVALVPAESDAARLAVAGGEPAEELHVTLMYLGDAADYTDTARAELVDALTRLVADAREPGCGGVVADGFAVSLFNPGDTNDRETCVVLGLSGEAIAAVHADVEEVVRGQAAAGGFALPEQHSPWVPHLTLIYSDAPGWVGALADRVGPVTFDRLRVAFGGQIVDIPLGDAVANRLGTTLFAREYIRDPDGQFAVVPGVGKAERAVKEAFRKGGGDDASGKKWKLSVAEAVAAISDTSEQLDPQTTAALTDAYTIHHAGLSTSDITAVGRVGPDGERYVYVKGIIRDQAGVPVGKFGRALSADGGVPTVHHGLLELDKNVRGQGFAQAFNAQAFDWYRESGVQRVELLANIDVGGYAWARAGYDWSYPADTKKIAARASRFSKQAGARVPADRREEQMRLAAEMAARLRSGTFGADDYPTPFEVSQLGRWPGAGKDDWWAGKAIMMGSHWSAVTAP